jgi:hypothetical protein
MHILAMLKPGQSRRQRSGLVLLPRSILALVLQTTTKGPETSGRGHHAQALRGAAVALTDQPTFR